MQDQQQRAKQYEKIHNVLFVVETGLTFVLLLAFLLSGLSRSLTTWVQQVSPNPWEIGRAHV